MWNFIAWLFGLSFTAACIVGAFCWYLRNFGSVDEG
jgi:hypothetical protein